MGNRSRLLPAVILPVLSFAVYANTLAGGFVYDDISQVLENLWIRDVRYLPEIFSKSVWNFQGNVTSNYYRPLMHVIYMANYHLFSLAPWGFHLVNVLFDAGNTVLVFLLAVRLFGGSAGRTGVVTGKSADFSSPPFLAALLFATHPIHAEAVAWVAGLPDLSYSFFFLLSLLLYIRSTEGMGVHKGRYGLSVVFFFLSVLCKEPAATLPFLLIAYDAAFRSPPSSPLGGGETSSPSPPTGGYSLKRYIPYFALLGFYFIVRTSALKGFSPVKAHGELDAYGYLINVFPLFAQYIGKLLMPVDLNAFHVLHPIRSLLEFKGIVGVGVAASFATATVVAYRKSRVAFLGLALIAVPLLPALYIPALGEASFAERYLYLPSVGFVVLLAAAFAWSREKWPRYGFAITVSVMILAILYSVQTVRRNPVWKDDLSLFSDTVRKSPDGKLPNKMLGIALMDAGRIDEAIDRFGKAISMDPSDFMVYNNRGLAFHESGRGDLALADFDRAIALNPRSFEAYNNKGKVYGQAGSLDKAIEHFSKAIAINPDFPLAYGNRGVAYTILGDYRRAWIDVTRAIELDERYSEAYIARGDIRLRTGNREQAISDYRKACDLGNPQGCRASQRARAGN